MAFDISIHDIVETNLMLLKVEALLNSIHDWENDGTTGFLSGSYVYNGQPSTWPMDKDIDVVLLDSKIEKELHDWLYAEYGQTTNEEYEDLSLYFRNREGRVFNLITLSPDKFKAWKSATDLVEKLCTGKSDLGKYLLENRPARVDVFVAFEKLAGIPQ